MILKAGTYRFNDVLTNFPTTLNTIYEGLSITTEDGYTFSCGIAHYDNYTDTDSNYLDGNYFGLVLNSVISPIYLDGTFNETTSNGWIADKTQVDNLFGVIPTDTEVDETFAQWFISNTNYNEVNAKPLAEITYNGETIAQLNAGDKATIPCSQYNMSKDLAIKVNEVPMIFTASSVDELPSDAPDGSLGVVKQPREGLKWRYLDWPGWQKSNARIDKYASKMWTNGINIYYSRKDMLDSVDNSWVLKGDTWEKKEWNVDIVDADYIWTDGKNVYYSDSKNHYVLNRDTWEPKTWNGFSYINGLSIWSDGNNIYFSNDNYAPAHYVLNGDTWETKTWGDSTFDFCGWDVWTDGKNIYHSQPNNHHVLNGDTWDTKTWNGLTDFEGEYVWTDGKNTYYTYQTNQYVLNGDTWEPCDVGVYMWNGNNVKNILGNTYISDSYGKFFLLIKDREILYTRVNGAWVERDILDEGAAETQEVTITPTQETQEIAPTSAEYISKVTVNPIPDGYVQPSGTKIVYTNQTTQDVTSNTNVYISTAIPFKVASESDFAVIMNEDVPNANAQIGNVFHYTGETTDTYENGTLYYLQAIPLITFYVWNGGSASGIKVTCTAEEGMTWTEWCTSEYNTNDLPFSVSVDTESNNICDSSSQFIYNSDGNKVSATDEITADTEYELYGK